MDHHTLLVTALCQIAAQLFQVGEGASSNEKILFFSVDEALAVSEIVKNSGSWMESVGLSH